MIDLWPWNFLRILSPTQLRFWKSQNFKNMNFDPWNFSFKTSFFLRFLWYVCKLDLLLQADQSETHTASWPTQRLQDIFWLGYLGSITIFSLCGMLYIRNFDFFEPDFLGSKVIILKFWLFQNLSWVGLSILRKFQGQRSIITRRIN